MLATNPFPTPPVLATTPAATGPDDVPITPPACAPIPTFGETAADPKLSAEWRKTAEITAIDIDTTNNSDVDDDNESEMDAHTPPTHDDRDRTAIPPTDAGGAEGGRQGSSSPLSDASAGDGPSVTVTAPTHSTLT
ncbi:hypothetical protein [Haloplanus natans]|uniref:hypothetical protein n=1 Tax=Haloplanus natans TaxID=376171 RepID=UPI0006779F95|nr:hypothetical protein [Haloplanus natans]